MSKVAVITPPELILDLDLVKKHCRVDDSDSDDLLPIYMGAAQANIDGPGGWLGRALGVQTLELRMESFRGQDWSFGHDWRGWDDCDTDWGRWSHPRRFARIELPYPPFISVTSITYEDQTGADQVLNPSGWNAVDGEVSPAFGDVWPTGRITADAVRIQYQAGYDAIGSARSCAAARSRGRHDRTDGRPRCGTHR
ncbi:MAG: head-tail connector protein [Caulobacteraceae bacterium]